MTGDQYLRNTQQIADLLKALDDSGLHEMKSAVNALVEYIDAMNEKKAQMLEEIQGMRSEISRLQDSSLQAKCAKLIASAEERVNQLGAVASVLKKNLIASAKQTVKDFQEKGKDAMARAVEAMCIPSALSHLKEACHRASQATQQQIDNVEALRGRLHDSAEHLKNAGHALAGKPEKLYEQADAEKGVLAKVRKGLEGMDKTFSSMERGAEKLIEKLQRGRAAQAAQTAEKPVEKASVKKELCTIRTEKSTTPVPPMPNLAEKAR